MKRRRITAAARVVAWACAFCAWVLGAGSARGADSYTYVDLGLGKAVAITNSGWVVAYWLDGPYIGNGAAPTILLRDRYEPGFTVTCARDGADGTLWLAGSLGGGSRVGAARVNTGDSAIEIFRPGTSAASRGINASGEVVGAVEKPRRPFLYADGGAGWTVSVLPDFGGGASPYIRVGANAISDSGYVVGSQPDGGGNLRAFVYKDGVMTDIGPGYALDVNESGQVLAKATTGISLGGYIYDHGRVTPLETDEDGIGYELTAINRWGQVLGVRMSVPGGPVPFVWERGTFRYLKPQIAGAGFSLDYPVDINDRGQITGWASYPSDPNHLSHAVILTPAAGSSAFYPATAAQDMQSAGTRFVAAPTGTWFAPAADGGDGPAAAPPPAPPAPDRPAPAYTYMAAPGAAFVRVADFPVGFAGDFTVSVDGTVLGEFAPGQSVRFADFADVLGNKLVGDGVARFTVAGITPLPDLQLAYALKLDFGGPTADFSIHARNALAGDADGDGAATFADFVILRGHFGSPGRSWFDGDFDLDGSVGAADFFLLRDSFTVPPDATQAAEIDAFAATVPEPGALGAVGLAAALLLMARRGKTGRSGLPGRSFAALRMTSSADSSICTGGA